MLFLLSVRHPGTILIGIHLEFTQEFTELGRIECRVEAAMDLGKFFEE